MLDHVFRSLRPGGRLVVVDRAGATEAQHTHEVPLEVVEGQLRSQGFEIVSHDDSLIHRPGDDLRWLVTARKP